jgi:hypothetical protein
VGSEIIKHSKVDGDGRLRWCADIEHLSLASLARDLTAR